MGFRDFYIRNRRFPISSRTPAAVLYAYMDEPLDIPLFCKYLHSDMPWDEVLMTRKRTMSRIVNLKGAVSTFFAFDILVWPIIHRDTHTCTDFLRTWYTSSVAPVHIPA